MSEIDPHSRNAIFIKYGRFQAGAYGWLGIVALVAVFLLLARYLNLW